MMKAYKASRFFRNFNSIARRNEICKVEFRSGTIVFMPLEAYEQYQRTLNDKSYKQVTRVCKTENVLEV